MMDQAIRDFPKQFDYEPVISQGPLHTYEQYLVCGMGGSHLAADILKEARPDLLFVIHSDYGLPSFDESKKPLVILSSYSGDTEEVVSSMEEALKRGLPCLAIATKGKLIIEARLKGFPYIQLPDTHIQPRSALGFDLRALLKATHDAHGLKETKVLASKLDAASFEKEGKKLAAALKGKVPIIYSSRKNYAVVYNWKIKLNETGKIPDFYNVFPELNHNEMMGFDVTDTTRFLSEPFHFIFLRDASDRPRVQRRMDILEHLYAQRKLPVTILHLLKAPVYEKIFSSLLLADWTAYYIALLYGNDPEQVPMVEDFKKMMEG